MKCPKCDMRMQRGETECPRCGGAGNMTAAQQRRAEFDSLPPCYACGGAGLMPGDVVQVEQNAGLARLGRKQVTNGETQGISACDCQRGEWMRQHGKVFDAPTFHPASRTKVIT